MKPANLGIRALAAIFDSVIMSLLWYYAIETYGTAATSGGQESTAIANKALTGAPAILLMLATALFWIIPEWLFSATLGKFVFSLRAVSIDGTRLTFEKSANRNVLRLVDFFPFYLTGFICALLTENRQRLGDLWAKTIVVSRREKIG